jgi:putative aldouronate transport system substrate-binding protein
MKKLSLLCILLALTVVLAACALPNSGGATPTSAPAQTGKDANTPAPEKVVPKKIGILAITFNGTPIAQDEPAVLALEKLTGYDINLEFLLNSSYEDQLNTRMAAQNLPALVAITGKTASVISNCRAGAFWDITNYYKNYPNLYKANDIVMNNISIDGKIYGIYRARPLGRNAISYRKDWLVNVGLSEPKTMDELYNVLKAFTTNDPDKNGQNDTYGMTWCKFFGPLDQIAVAFGAPNKWGVSADNKLVPYFDTPEYMESMKYIKKLYDEGLINKDYAAMETSEWTKDFQNSKSGVHIDVSDQAWRYQKNFIERFGIVDLDPEHARELLAIREEDVDDYVARLYGLRLEELLDALS